MAFSVTFIAGFYDNETLTFTGTVTSDSGTSTNTPFSMAAEVRDASDPLVPFALQPLLKTLTKNAVLGPIPPSPNFLDVPFLFNGVGPVVKVAIQIITRDVNGLIFGESLLTIPNVTPPVPIPFDVRFLVDQVSYELERVNSLKTRMTPLYSDLEVGLKVRYIMTATDSTTNIDLATRTLTHTLTDDVNLSVKRMNVIIPDPISHPLLRVTWLIEDVNTLVVYDSTQQIISLDVAPPTEDDTVATDMITISPGVFELKDDRVTGRVNYIATSAFNPFWFGKNLLTNFEILDGDGGVIVEKQVNINFTDTERDEFININEFAFGNKTVTVRVTTFVSLADVRFFSAQESVIILDSTGCPAGMQKNPDTGLCEPIPPEPTEEKNPFTPLIVGALALGFIGSSLLDKKQPKRRKR